MLKCIQKRIRGTFMKKIIITILVLLIVGAGGTAYYFLTVKTYDLSQDTVLEEMTKEEYEIVLPPDADANAITSGEGSDKDSNNTGIENPPVNDAGEPTPEAKSPSSTTNVTVDTIKERYRPSFENLEAQANGKIKALVGRAFSEYSEKKVNGEEISYSYFLTKYKTAGEALEAKTDQAFEKLYGALQQELKDNGFDPNEAADVRSAYEAEKKERGNALLSKALDQL